MKKILTSPWTRGGFSVILIYFAFRKIDVLGLLGEISKVPLWLTLGLLAYMVFTTIIGVVRWCILIIEKPSLGDVFNFARAAYIGAFYGLFFPSAVGGDLVKWLPLLKKYPQLSKTRLVSSILVDRIIGFSAFVVMAFFSIVLGKFLRFQFPDYLFWLFFGLFLTMILFYIVVFSLDFEKIFGRFKLLRKLLEIVDLLKSENKSRIMKCFLISIIAEPIWILPNWFYSLVFDAGLSLLSVYVFMPVISLILVLPVSVAGFGAREQLYLYFFTQLGLVPEKVLLVSTFSGVLGVLNSLLGGLLILL